MRTLIEKNVIDFVKALNATKDGKVARFVVTETTTDPDVKPSKSEIRYEVQCKEEMCGKQIVEAMLPYVTIIVIATLLIISLLSVEYRQDYSYNISTVIGTELDKK